MYTGRAIDELIEMVEVAEQHAVETMAAPAFELELHPAFLYERENADLMVGVA